MLPCAHPLPPLPTTRPASPGTKVGYYFAWLKFYTAALVFPTVIGLWVWWTERVNAENASVCVPGMHVCRLFEMLGSAVPFAWAPTVSVRAV